jgi:outer membrane murein-binding lipoprotein Lpp
MRQMTMMAKRVGGFVALLVTLLGGWLWGASGRWDLDRALQTAELRSDLLATRGALLAARLDLYGADVRELSRHLQDAREFAGRAEVRLENLGWKDEARRLDLTGFAAEIDSAERTWAKPGLGTHARAARETTAMK